MPKAAAEAEREELDAFFEAAESAEEVLEAAGLDDEACKSSDDGKDCDVKSCCELEPAAQEAPESGDWLQPAVPASSTARMIGKNCLDMEILLLFCLYRIQTLLIHHG